MKERTRKVSTTSAIAYVGMALVSTLVLTAVAVSPIELQIPLFSAYCTYVMWQWRYQLTHPLLWFPAVFILYSVSYPALISLGYYPKDRDAEKLLFLHTVALIAFVFGVGVRARGRQGYLRLQFARVRILEQTAKLVSIPLVLITVLIILKVFQGGYSSKQEIALARTDSIILRLDFAYLFLTLTVALILIARWQRHASVKYTAGALFAWFALSYLVIGERDLVFRFVLVFMLAGWELRRLVRPRTVYLVALVGLSILPASQSLKSWMVGGSTDLRYDLFVFLGGEFRSASQNLHIMLRLDQPLRWGETFVWDLQRVASSRMLKTSAQSTGEWFNAVVLDGMVSGRGFSLVAEGYMNFGTLGVAGVYLFLGAVTGYAYRRRFKGVVWYACYLMYVPIVVYVQRADLANYISLTLKTVVIPATMIWMASGVLESLKPSYYRRRSARPADRDSLEGPPSPYLGVR